MPRSLPARILFAALALTACSDAAAPPSEPDVLLTNDVALSSGVAVSRDVGGLVGMGFGMLGMPGRLGGPPGAFDRGDCPYSEETGWYECTITLPGGAVMSWSYSFLAADGAPQRSFDDATTGSVRSRSTFARTLTTDRGTLTMRHERAATVSGLLGAETEHVWNATGTRNDRMESLGDGPARSHSIASSDTATNVVWRLPVTEHRWPASGTIVHNVAVTDVRQGDRVDTRSHARRVVVTFNGTQFVPMVVGDREFTLDLATGRVDRQR